MTRTRQIAAVDSQMREKAMQSPAFTTDRALPLTRKITATAPDKVCSTG